MKYVLSMGAKETHYVEIGVRTFRRKRTVPVSHSPILNHDRIFRGEFAQIWQIRGTLSQVSAAPPVYQVRRST